MASVEPKLEQDRWVVEGLRRRRRGSRFRGEPGRSLERVATMPRLLWRGRERINRVSGGLAPEFETFPVSRWRAERRGNGATDWQRGQGGRDQGWNEGQCLHKTTRAWRLQAVGSRLPPRRLLCGLRSPWLRALPDEPRLKFNSNSVFCICWSAFPRRSSTNPASSLSARAPPPRIPTSAIGRLTFSAWLTVVY